MLSHRSRNPPNESMPALIDAALDWSMQHLSSHTVRCDSAHGVAHTGTQQPMQLAATQPTASASAAPTVADGSQLANHGSCTCTANPSGSRKRASTAELTRRVPTATPRPVGVAHHYCILYWIRKMLCDELAERGSRAPPPLCALPRGLTSLGLTA